MGKTIDANGNELATIYDGLENVRLTLNSCISIGIDLTGRDIIRDSGDDTCVGILSVIEAKLDEIAFLSNAVLNILSEVKRRL